MEHRRRRPLALLVSAETRRDREHSSQAAGRGCPWEPSSTVYLFRFRNGTRKPPDACEGVRDTRSFGRCFVLASRSQCTSRACARSPVRRRTPRNARNPPSRCRRRRAQGVLAASLRPTASGTSLRFPTPSLVESGSSSDSATMGCTTSKQDVMTDVARQESSRSIDSTLAGVDISALPRKTFTAGNPQRVRRAFDPRPTWLFASSTRSGHASQKSASHRSSVCQWPQNPASRPPSAASD